MTVTAERIDYVYEQRSLDYIARETGLSIRTVQQSLDGTISLTPHITNPIRSLFQREAYRRLQDAGFSPHQANRYRSYSVSTINEVTESITDKIEYLAGGLLGERQYEEGIIYDQEEYDNLFAEAIADIRYGMRNSEKIYEQWMDY